MLYGVLVVKFVKKTLLDFYSTKFHVSYLGMDGSIVTMAYHISAEDILHLRNE